MLSERQVFKGPFPVDFVDSKRPNSLRLRVFAFVLIEQASNVTAIFLNRDNTEEYPRVWAEKTLGMHRFSSEGPHKALEFFDNVMSSRWEVKHAIKLGLKSGKGMRAHKLASGLIAVGGDAPVVNQRLARLLDPLRDLVFSNGAKIFLQQGMLGNNLTEKYYNPVRLTGEQTLRDKLKEALQDIVSNNCPTIIFQDLLRVFPPEVYLYDKKLLDLKLVTKRNVKPKAKSKSLSDTVTMDFVVPIDVSTRNVRQEKKHKSKPEEMKDTHMAFSFS